MGGVSADELGSRPGLHWVRRTPYAAVGISATFLLYIIKLYIIYDSTVAEPLMSCLSGALMKISGFIQF